MAFTLSSSSSTTTPRTEIDPGYSRNAINDGVMENELIHNKPQFPPEEGVSSTHTLKRSISTLTVTSVVPDNGRLVEAQAPLATKAPTTPDTCEGEIRSTESEKTRRRRAKRWRLWLIEGCFLVVSVGCLIGMYWCGRRRVFQLLTKLYPLKSSSSCSGYSMSSRCRNFL